MTHSVFYAPQYVAMSQGLLCRRGAGHRPEQRRRRRQGHDRRRLRRRGYRTGGAGSCIYIHGQGKDDLPVIFAQLTKRDGSFLVGRTDEDFDWSNLKGKTIIGGRKGGVPEMTLEYVMRHNGVEPQEDAVVDTSVQFNMMAGAFTGGQGDYVTLFEPTATEVERAGHGYILCSIGEESGEIPYTAYFAARSYRDAHPEVIQGFANAIACAQQWIVEHTDRGGGAGHHRPVPGHRSGYAGGRHRPSPADRRVERRAHDGALGAGAAGDGDDRGSTSWRSPSGWTLTRWWTTASQKRPWRA